MDFVICIPSHRRIDCLRTKTLALLSRYRVDPSRIHVYVDPDEMADYAAALHAMDSKDATDTEARVRLRPGRRGLLAQRRAIREDWPEDQAILCMDDDVETLYQLDAPTRCLRDFDPADGFTAWAAAHFQRLRDSGRLRLWGIYPVRNAYFMGRGGLSTHPCFIVGAFYGFLNSRDPSREATREEKEDVERSLRAARLDGGVLRDNDITLRTRYYTEPGGMQAAGTDRRAAAAASAAFLAATYPELCYLYKGKRSGFHEVRWRRGLARKS